ncbi:MAG: hypothetical protein LBH32_08970 [Dysgonamonadaceae bacterium]|jgi:hypothetical protein|nr:hypothetical protein [Dysgonamonadaceae bacterium]
MIREKANITKLMCIGLLALSAIPVYQQITVGIGLPPVKGALLDIKDRTPDSNNVTATKGGLLLPRVKLKAKDNLRPFIQPGTSGWQELARKHTGLTVYNLTNDSYFIQGVYVWNGEKWTPTDEAKEQWAISGNGATATGTDFLGTTDNSSLFFRTSNTACMQIDSTEITLNDALVATDTLTLNDVLYMNNLPISPSSEVSIIMLDSTGQANIVKSSSGNDIMFNHLTYTIANVDGCKLASFNTQIPESQYTLVIVGSTFILGVNGEHLVNGTSQNGYNPQKIVSRAIGGLWHLSADYTGGKPVNGNGVKVNGTWRIDCIAVNNAIVQVITDALDFNFNGNNSGSALRMPDGL